jgi:hypothetical protein
MCNSVYEIFGFFLTNLIPSDRFGSTFVFFEADEVLVSFEVSKARVDSGRRL